MKTILLYPTHSSERWYAKMIGAKAASIVIDRHYSTEISVKSTIFTLAMYTPAAMWKAYFTSM